jgi:hypothetical protein
MSERWPGGIITKTPITPTGPNYNGTAPGVWTIEQAAYWQRQGLWPTQGIGVADIYFPYVSYLMSTTATNAQQNNTFLDSSSNNFTVNRNGNTTQGSVNPYGTLWSNYFDGTGDYLSGSASNVMTGNFTVEMWAYFQGFGAGAGVYTIGNETTQRVVFYVTSGGALAWDLYGAGTTSFPGATVPLNTWVHIAFVKSGSTIIAYLNGTSAGSRSMPYTVGNANGFFVGGSMNGYLSNFRVVNGTAVYTSDFTPPTSPLTAISGTLLLTCQSNRFRDNSTNNFTLTRNGDTRVTNFNPFSPSSPGYVAATSGGSISFDGATDWLNMGGQSAFAYGTGAFTIECWFYALGLGQMIIDGRPPSTNGNYVLVAVGGGGTLEYYSNNVGQVLGNTQIQLGAWNHFAIARSGTTTKMFLNGIENASFSDNTNYEAATDRPIIGTNGYRTDLSHFNGYMANFRIVKGTAVYTANFTPPTSPVTAISGTSLLLNATNAGIFDAATINNMETVGNAQVSTTQAKFGTTSVAFDGTGDYLYLPPNSNLPVGTSNFTVECWIYALGTPSDSPIFECRSTGSATDGFTLTAFSSSVIRVFCGSALISSSATTYVNQWVHLAVVRSSGTTTFYINGTSVGSTVTTINWTNQDAVIGGGRYSAGSTINVSFNGYIDDFRITKGVARYTANFAPPVTAFVPY